VFHQAPVPLRHHRPDCPPALEAVILRCLQKNPAHRFGNVAELAAALVDFRTPSARLSTERISRTLGVALAATAGYGGQPTSGGDARLPAGGGLGADRREPAQTGRSTWGSTNPVDGKRRSGNPVVLVSVLGVLLAAVVFGVVIFMKLTSSPPADVEAPGRTGLRPRRSNSTKILIAAAGLEGRPAGIAD
jgi:hypothetical protein